MQKRATPSAQFPGHVCEHRAQETLGRISVDTKVLPTLSPTVERIAVIGDTGCRIRGNRAQACNDPSAWPLTKIAEEVASRSPDLIIHVGDYLYRSSECPDAEKCGGSPFGDTFQAWSADWLTPAEQLFQAAPFLFLRGNHENCGRGDKGWFRYFADGPVPSDCPAVSQPWITSFDGLDLIVFDSSAGPAPHSSPDLLPEYSQMARDLIARTNGEGWLLTHRPLWANMRAFGELINGDDTQRAAFGGAMPQAVTLILSGHIHAFQAIDLSDGPVQSIVGNSGTQLDPMPTGVARDIEIAGHLADLVVNNGEFGFLMLTKGTDNTWLMEAIGDTGQVQIRCQLAESRLTCI